MVRLAASSQVWQLFAFLLLSRLSVLRLCLLGLMARGATTKSTIKSIRDFVMSECIFKSVRDFIVAEGIFKGVGDSVSSEGVAC